MSGMRVWAYKLHICILPVYSAILSSHNLLFIEYKKSIHNRISNHKAFERKKYSNLWTGFCYAFIIPMRFVVFVCFIFHSSRVLQNDDYKPWSTWKSINNKRTFIHLCVFVEEFCILRNFTFKNYIAVTILNCHNDSENFSILLARCLNIVPSSSLLVYVNNNSNYLNNLLHATWD